LLLCPGRRPVEVRAGGRIVWWREVDLPAEDEVVVEIRSRPNATVLGADDWPSGLRAFGSSFSTRGGMPLPTDRDLATAEGWEGVRLPPHTDLALAVLPPPADGLSPVWLLHSPILGTVARVTDQFDVPRPRWHVTFIGVRLADSALGGPARVVAVFPGSPAESAGIAPGDRVVSVDGIPVDSSAAAMRVIETRPPGSAFPIGLVSLAGAPRDARCTGSRSPKLERLPPDAGRDAVTAAWASVDAATSPDEASSSRANLALLLSDRNRHDLAASLWRQVRWGDRVGVGEGTRAYYLARELETLGLEQEARELYRSSAASAAAAFRDGGIAIAPAARDRLADLGAELDARP
jgi:hypothetical protein